MSLSPALYQLQHFYFRQCVCHSARLLQKKQVLICHEQGGDIAWYQHFWLINVWIFSPALNNTEQLVKYLCRFCCAEACFVMKTKPI